MESVTQHKPVLVQEVLDALKIAPGNVYLDVTFGGGGHTRAILAADPTVTVFALDWDLKAVDRAEPFLEEYGSRLKLMWGSFGHLYKLEKKYKFPLFNGILADFGTSQDQIHGADGFSFMHDTPLDMRMSQGHFKTTAAHVVNYATEQELCEIFWTYGEENRAKEIVRRIIDARKKTKIKTTKQLADVVEHALGPRRNSRIHPATKVFQALRIFVNKELENITSFLPAAFKLLAPEGRLACISFHSLEDRLVKEFCKTVEKEGSGSSVYARPVTPSEEEIIHNPSSRSSKLRVLEKRRSVSV